MKLKEGEKEVCRPMIVDEGTNKEKTLYFQPSATARKLCVEHLKDTVDLNRLYTAEVLTEDVINKLEPIVNEKFRYGTDELDIESLDEILEDEKED